MTCPKILTVTARKGGVGKTALSTSIASLFAQRGIDTVLLDFDTQSSAATALGGDPIGDGCANWLRGECETYQIPQPGLRLLAGGPGLDHIRALSLERFRSKLESLNADLVVVDTPPVPTKWSRLAVEVADVVLVASEPHPLALSGAVVILNDLREAQERALVLNRVEAKRALHRDIAEGAARAFGGINVFCVRNDTRFERLLALGIPVATASSSKAIWDLQRICGWVENTRSRK